MNHVVGRLIDVKDDDPGRSGTVDVRGARISVPLLLIPEASIGDTVLVDAGVAVAVVGPARSSGTMETRD